jgi:chorismate mutase
VRSVRVRPVLVAYAPHYAKELKEKRVSSASNDPVVKQYREQISDNDIKILEALNKRIKLVKSLKDYKDTHGLSFYDPAQEDWVITYLCRANRGPLTNEGLREVYQLILQVAKREAAAISEKERAEAQS